MKEDYILFFGTKIHHSFYLMKGTKKNRIVIACNVLDMATLHLFSIYCTLSVLFISSFIANETYFYVIYMHFVPCHPIPLKKNPT